MFFMAYPLYEWAKIVYNDRDYNEEVGPMYCMKCGKETQADQVFCERCLQVMDAYPVKPDAAIHLPRRNPAPVAKKTTHRKRVPTPEEQLVQLKQANRRLMIIGLVLALLWGITIGALVYQLMQPDEAPAPATTKNYTYASESEGTR